MLFSARRSWTALLVLLLPVLVVQMSVTTLHFALPAIAEQLRPTAAQQLWIVDIYPLVLAGLLIPMGSLGDRFGRRRMLLMGTTGFVLTSTAGAFAPTPEMLIASRVATAVFGSMLLPATLSLIRTVFIDDGPRRLAVAIWTAAFSAATAIGPMIGGVLLDTFAWGSILLIPLPLGAVFLAAAPFLLPESRHPTPGPVDLPSALLALASMVPVVFAIKALATGEPLVVVVASLAAGLGFSAVFISRQRRIEHPMLDMSMFASSRFSGAVVVNVLSSFTAAGLLYVIAQHLQLLSGMSATMAAVALAPATLTMILTSISAPRLATRHQPGRIIVCGLALILTGFTLITLAGSAPTPWVVIVAFTLVNAGMGFTATMGTDLIIGSVPAERAGAASAVSETAYEFGTVLGTAGMGGLTTAFYTSFLVVPAGTPADDVEAASQTLGAALDVADRQGPQGQALAEAARLAFSAGEQITAAIVAALLLVATPLIARAVRQPQPPPETGTTEVAAEETPYRR
jgi:DHA2 family multidrug resistance protein-like MFS transporter